MTAVEQETGRDTMNRELGNEGIGLSWGCETWSFHFSARWAVFIRSKTQQYKDKTIPPRATPRPCPGRSIPR
jgi:hypothetical protein